MHKTVVVIMVLSCWLHLSFGQNPENLVLNSGFETGEGEEPSQWVKRVNGDKLNYKSGIDKTEFHSGNASCKISRNWLASAGPGISTANPVTIDPHKKYLLNFWYKTRDIDEYPLALISKFIVRCEKTPSVRYQKNVSNSDQWKQYYILLDNIPADALDVRIDFCTEISTQGSIWLDDITFVEAGIKEVEFFEKWRRQQLPPIAGKAPVKKFKATGFYKVEKKQDRWWLVDPHGNRTWAFAVAGTVPALDPENPVTQSDWFKQEYGTTRESVAKKIYNLFTEDCGFNSLAGWSNEKIVAISEERYNLGLPYMPVTQVLGLSSMDNNPGIYAQDREGRLLNSSGHPVVDPFNPVWRQAAREKAAKIIPRYKDKPWFVGWYIDNEMEFGNLYQYVWANFSSQEFIKNLKAKYSTIGRLNQKWTSAYGVYKYLSFNDILSDKPEPKDWNDPLWKDFADFERKMMGEYITYTYDLVKELDPDHLVISNRIHLGAITGLHRTIDLWSKYDIICMNIYPENNKIGFEEGELEIMKKLFEGTRRPVIIGEWSVPAIDSKLYSFGIDSLGRRLDWSWPQVLRTQKERGEAYEACIRQLASLDFVIGAGWFITMDVDSKVRRANRGLMNTKFEVYHELTDKMKAANEELKKEMQLKQ